jgi:hypothetical protein
MTQKTFARAAALGALAVAVANTSMPAFALPAVDVPVLQVVVDSVANPRNLSFDSNGDLYIPSAGVGGDQACAKTDEGVFCSGVSGSILKVSAQDLARPAALPVTATTVADSLPSMAIPGGELTHGVHGVAARDGQVYAVFISTEFLGTEHTEDCCRSDVQGPLREAALRDLGNLMQFGDHGRGNQIADVSHFEFAVNPVNDPHSNPYAVAIDRDRTFVVADAAGNTLLRVGHDGDVQLIAAFDNLNTGPLGPASTEAVPTGVAVGPDGNYYVSLLGGFHPTLARILQVTPRGAVRVVADGLTTLTSVAVTPGGAVYATEMVPGDLIRVLPDPARPGHFLPAEHLYQGRLTAPAGVAVAPNGWLYVSDRAVVSNPAISGRIVRVRA